MRAALSTIQQTLTAEAAGVLDLAVADAARRRHGQATPLHVAAALLAFPAGQLRQACVRSHPHSSHPLQCRALELCFSVALDRLPAAAGDSPAVSNALMAALKRAQAHQRRGCPESQQQPLLAVKVELEQLIVSILDDPSVSRVMREAGFSSPTVKSVVEQSLRPSPLPPTTNPYLNPRLQSPAVRRREDVRKVIDVLLRPAKRNPVIVGDSEPAVVAKEVLGMVERNEIGEPPLTNLQVVSLEKGFGAENDQIHSKLRNLESLIDERINSNNGGVIIDLGDLKWLVSPEIGRAVVPEMGKLLAKYRAPSPAAVWVMGTAKCETYLRCQVYYPSMEKDWDLQTISIAARSLLAVAGVFVDNKLAASTAEAAAAGAKFCASCAESCERELAKFAAMEGSVKKSTLPQWLQAAKEETGREGEERLKKEKKREELQKKWWENCRLLHPSFHTTSVPIVGLAPRAPSLLQPNLQIAPRNPLLSSRPLLHQSRHLSSPPANPVTTDLALGRPPAKEKTDDERVKDMAAGISTDWERQRGLVKQAAAMDADSFKSLSKGLAERVAWQTDAAAMVATVVVQSKSGGLRRLGGQAKSDTWMFFLGPDKVGKRKIAAALSDLLRRPPPATIRLGSGQRHHYNDDNDDDDSDVRKSTVIVRLADAIRRNPFSVIFLEDVDQANLLLCRSLTQAMETGWLVDSHGRQVSLGSTIFILTSDWTPENAKSSFPPASPRDEKVAAMVAADYPLDCTWQLQLSAVRQPTKRPADWSPDDRPAKVAAGAGAGAGGGVCFDLNLAATEAEEGSNSREITTETPATEPSLPTKEVAAAVDETVVFRPVDFGPLRRAAVAAIAAKFSAVVGEGQGIEVEEEALDRVVGGVWFGRTGLDEWVDRVLVPGFRQLSEEVDGGWSGVRLRLVATNQVDGRSGGGGGGAACGSGGDGWLPGRVMIEVGLV